MQSAKQAVSEFLHHGNKHTVDIEQETKPAVVKETISPKQHEDVTTAVDREVHQHHHQIHVQPVQDRVVDSEQHHHNVIPVEHRHKHHGKDEEVQRTLAEHQSQFRDEQQILPTQTTSSKNAVVGEHVHHHIHDVIQPVVERETIQPHVVHTTVPIHEHIEHEPFVHQSNVLPSLSMEEFTRAGHSLHGSGKSSEHIDYEGEPLKIDGKSHVGFGHLHQHGNNTTGTGLGDNTTTGTGLGHNNTTGTGLGHNNTTGTGLGDSTVTGAGVGGQEYTHGRGAREEGNLLGSRGAREEAGIIGNGSDSSNVPRSMSSEKNNTTGPHKSSLLNKLDPRVSKNTV